MEKIIMVYASMTGNTEEIAKFIEIGVKQAGVHIETRECFTTDAKELEEYDGVLVGSYTYGDGELADEFLDFYEEMEGLKLEGKLAAVFGSGDRNYDHFCAAVDILTEKLMELDAVIAQDGLKIELTPEDEEVCIDFGRSFAEKLKNVKSIIG